MKNFAKKIVSQLPCGGALTEISGEIVYANENFAKILGYNYPTELIGVNFKNITHKDDLEHNESFLKQLLNGERQTVCFAKRYITKDNKIVYVELNVSIFEDHDKKKYWLAIVQDVTKFMTFKEIKNLALDQTNIGIWEWNIENDYLMWDNNMHKIFETNPEDFVPHVSTFFNHVHPEDQSKVKEYVEYCVENKQLYIKDFKIITKNGNIKHVNAKAKVYSDANNKLIKMIGINQDITDRIENLKKLEIQNQKLKESNQELENFAYVASHDLQEPLRTISSFCRLIEKKYKDKLDEDGVEFIEFIVDASNRMKKLLDDLLQISRITTHVSEKSIINTNEELRRILDTLAAQISETEIKINIEEDLPQVLMHKIHFTQLFQNLISNAVKFRNKNILTKIEIGYHDTQDDNFYIFYVKDNGIGFDIKYEKKIFEIFQRLHHRDEYNGTGVGLALCKKIVNYYGGEITVESEVDEGTIFCFTLPRIKHESNKCSFN